ncbi:ribonuclease E/G [Aliigemmobacter aestuarii]|uniref:Ribonuclease E n=1 Tax=Aliigemmobacter aestuarii TaxID=1445661 RepID=A0A4S3MKU7_9RHOB|nr:ribonuclease E/G [Gemmobacter aestuarii]THD81217.1 ribonuclease E/G [Gemmobacter aestuarii]
MAKKMLIDATHAEETRVVVVDGNKVEEFDFETVNKRQLQGNIYLAKVTRVEPSLQAAFVDYGGNRHGFLAFAEIHPDYYQIPVADRKALLEEERAMARAEDEEDNRRSRKPRRDKAPRAEKADTVATRVSTEIAGMDVVDLGEDDAGAGIEAEPLTGAEAQATVTEVAADTADSSDTSDAPEAGEAAPEAGPDAPARSGEDRDEPYRAVDHAADIDDEIESVADEDVTEEIRAPRRPRARRYKIQEVIKVRQIMLVQVVKEERGNKGAALTTYLSLAGRYCVLMPNTARGGGISRKITQAADRKKLKEIAGEMEVPEGAGLIIRTAGAKRTKAEIKRDYEYLMRLWEQIRELTLKSIAPAPIYEEGNLIKRSIRDLYNREIDEVLVEGEAGYRTAKDFMRMIMPSHAKMVKRYDEPMPLFARHQVESYLSGMFNPTVQLKSGGYIVIGVTEALVAIDVNSGRATKEGSIEETALKTNLEAADEVARQLRLRDLAGLIVIDFIDMEERKNNAAVEKRLKEKLKTDRARIQVGRISGFGLLEMSRQRLRPGMLESTTQPCPHCHGTGLIRSDDSMALTILRALEEEGTRKRSKEVLLKAPVAVVNYLMNAKREHIALIEARYGMAVRIEADPHLVSPDYSMEKFKTATRVVPDTVTQAISGNASLMGEWVEEDEDLPVEEDEVEEAEEAAAEAPARSEAGDAASGNGNKKKRRRRRRRRGGSGASREGEGQMGAEDGDEGSDAEGADEDDAEGAAESGVPAEAADDAVTEEKPKKSRSRSRSSRSKAKAETADTAATAAAPDAAAVAQADTVEAETPAAEAVETVEDAPKAKSTRSTKAKASTAKASAPKAKSASKSKATVAETANEADGEAPKPASRSRKPKAKATEDAAPVPQPAAEPEAAPEPAPVAEGAPDAGLQPDPGQVPVAETTAPDPAEAEAPQSDAGEPKPRRKGWWSLGR